MARYGKKAQEKVEKVMRERHPELSAAALEKLSNYFTFLVK